MNKILFVSLISLVISFSVYADDHEKIKNWSHFGNDSGGSQYSPLNQINIENVKNLKVAWVHNSGDFKKNPGGLSFQVTPIMANNLLYYCTPFNRVFAIDPLTGEEIWVFDPHYSDEKTKPLIDGERLYGTCRGVSYWEDTQIDKNEFCSKRIFKGDGGGHLWAIDAETGLLCKDFAAKTDHPGRVSNSDYASNGEGWIAMPSPVVIIGDVVVGARASSDGIQNANDGFVRGWDVRTGELKWEFNPIPADRVDQTGAANVWSTMSADPENNLVFLPTTSPSTDYYGGARRFPIPHANAIVAINSNTGEIAWSYQTIKHDLFDYDLVGHPLLVDIQKDNQTIKAAILQTKMGWLFVFNRLTGEPIWPITEMDVPSTNIPEDKEAKTQPIPTLPVPFSRQKILRENLFGLTPFDKSWCKSEFDKMRYEGLYTPPDLREALLFPSALGGGNWGGAAFDKKNNLLIIKAENLATRLQLVPKDGKPDSDFEYVDYLTRPLSGVPYAAKGEIFMSPLGIPCTPTPWGTLMAIDMSSGLAKWEIPIGSVKRFGITIPESFGWGSPNIGGPIVTSGGLVFMAGTMDEKIRAFNVINGNKVWEHKLPAQGSAVPMTYMVNNKQFLVIAAGGTGRVTNNLGDSIVAFSLK